MFELIRFEPEHVVDLLKEEINVPQRIWFTEGYAEKLKTHARSYTVLINGEIMMCGGVSLIWAGRGYMWTLFSEKAKHHSVAIYRRIKKLIPKFGLSRIELDIPWDFELGIRRAAFMGFKCEVPRAVKYLPDGSDAALFAWVRE